MYYAHKFYDDNGEIYYLTPIEKNKMLHRYDSNDWLNSEL